MTDENDKCRSIEGVGVGLRSDHYAYIINQKPQIPWFEILSDNYLVESGKILYQLDQIAERYPLVMHSVGLSIGSTDPLNKNYLLKLRKLKERVNPILISDHLCWVSVDNEYLHELMPLPYDHNTVMHVVDRVKQVQDFLGQQILLENVSSYMTYKQSQMSEWEFLSAIIEKADCKILLDINNIYVSAHNHGFNAMEYLEGIDASRIAQFHMAGFTDMKTHFLDTHGAKVDKNVWSLYEDAIKKFGPVPTLMEWDNDIPSFEVLQEEASRAQLIMDRVQGKKHAVT